MKHPTTIVIQVIPHADQRYETCGDWYIEGDILRIQVSALSDWKRSMLTAIHEYIEYVLCADAGITQEMVDNFDLQYEEERLPGDNTEPGNSPAAPYRSQHGIATGIERLLASIMGVIWCDYGQEINDLHLPITPLQVEKRKIVSPSFLEHSSPPSQPPTAASQHPEQPT